MQEKLSELLPYFATGGILVKHAFLWKNGVMTDLGTAGADPCSFAFNVNLKGQIVGGSQNAECNPFTHAVLWENGEPWALIFGIRAHSLPALGCN